MKPGFNAKAQRRRDGARASARFNVRFRVARETPDASPIRELKRCERRAPSNPDGIPSQSPGLRVPHRSAAKTGGRSYPGKPCGRRIKPNGVVDLANHISPTE